MGTIAREFFRASPVLFYPLLALGLFILVFVLVSVRAWLRGANDPAALLPLEDRHE